MSKFIKVCLVMGGSEALALLRYSRPYRDLITYRWCPVKDSVAEYLKKGNEAEALKLLEKGYRIDGNVWNYLLAKAKFIRESGLLEDANKAGEDPIKNCFLPSTDIDDKPVSDKPIMGSNDSYARGRPDFKETQNFMRLMLAPSPEDPGFLRRSYTKFRGLFTNVSCKTLRGKWLLSSEYGVPSSPP